MDAATSITTIVTAVASATLFGVGGLALGRFIWGSLGKQEKAEYERLRRRVRDLEAGQLAVTDLEAAHKAAASEYTAEIERLKARISELESPPVRSPLVQTTFGASPPPPNPRVFQTAVNHEVENQDTVPDMLRAKVAALEEQVRTAQARMNAALDDRQAAIVALAARTRECDALQVRVKKLEEQSRLSPVELPHIL